MSQYLSHRLTITETDVGPSRRRRHLKLKCDSGATRFSFFVFRFSFSQTKNEKRFVIPIFDFQTWHENRKTVTYTEFRFSYAIRKSKNEIRYNKPFFVFRIAYEKRNNDTYTDLFHQTLQFSNGLWLSYDRPWWLICPLGNLGTDIQLQYFTAMSNIGLVKQNPNNMRTTVHYIIHANN